MPHQRNCFRIVWDESVCCNAAHLHFIDFMDFCQSRRFHNGRTAVTKYRDLETPPRHQPDSGRYAMSRFRNMSRSIPGPRRSHASASWFRRCIIDPLAGVGWKSRAAALSTIVTRTLPGGRRYAFPPYALRNPISGVPATQQGAFRCDRSRCGTFSQPLSARARRGGARLGAEPAIGPSRKTARDPSCDPGQCRCVRPRPRSDSGHGSHPPVAPASRIGVPRRAACRIPPARSRSKSHCTGSVPSSTKGLHARRARRPTHTGPPCRRDE